MDPRSRIQRLCEGCDQTVANWQMLQGIETMKHLMTAALALTLLSGTSALAQNDQHHGGPGGGEAPHGAAPGGGGGHPGGGAPHAGAPGGGAAPAFHAAPQPGAAAHAAPPPGFAPRQGGNMSNLHAFDNAGARGPAGGRSEGQGGGARDNAVAGPSRAGGQAGFQGREGRGGGAGFQGGGHAGGPAVGGPRTRFNPGAFPHEVRPQGRFEWRGRAWRPQPGYYARHWGYGDRLPYGWYASRWYVNDYYDYDLPTPPYDYMWVRVGEDALLVNIYNGTVVEAEYGIFY
jgi:Ni/Co efflux regulator RcnB